MCLPRRTVPGCPGSPRGSSGKRTTPDARIAQAQPARPPCRTASASRSLELPQQWPAGTHRPAAVCRHASGPPRWSSSSLHRHPRPRMAAPAPYMPRPRQALPRQPTTQTFSASPPRLPTSRSRCTGSSAEQQPGGRDVTASDRAERHPATDHLRSTDPLSKYSPPISVRTNTPSETHWAL